MNNCVKISLQDFSGCGGRFEHQLTGDPYHLADATTCGSQVLCFYTLGESVYCISQVYLLNIARQWKTPRLKFWTAFFSFSERDEAAIDVTRLDDSSDEVGALSISAKS